MHRTIVHGVELHVPGQDPVGLGGHLDLENAGEKARLLHLLDKIGGIHRNEDRIDLGTVDDARYAPPAAHGKLMRQRWRAVVREYPNV